MSEQLIASLQQRIEQLTTENTDLKAEAKQRRVENKKLQAEIHRSKGGNRARDRKGAIHP